MTSPRTVENPFSLKHGNVLENVLDQVDASSYVIGLSMIDYNSIYRNTYYSGVTEKVIIAQTGLTGIIIDDLEIDAISSGSRSFEFASANFKIVQPGAADLFDKIAQAKAQLGIPFRVRNLPMLLEIEFKGYDPETGLPNSTVSGPYAYLVEITNVEFDITTEGSTYNFETRIVDYTGFSDLYYRAKRDIETRGATIREHLNPDGLGENFGENQQSLKSQLNKFQTENNTDHLLPDFYEIDLSQIPDDILDEELVFDAEAVNDYIRNADPNLQHLSPEEIDELSYEDLRSRASVTIGADTRIGRVGNIFGSITNTYTPNARLNRGTTIEYYMATLFNFSKKFADLQCRFDFNNLNNIRPGQPTVTKLVVDVRVEYRNKVAEGSNGPLAVPPGYDPSRNLLAKKITFVPRLIETVGENQCVSPAEHLSVTSADQQSRLSALNITKAYYYMFTGRNDQIINLDISYRNGIAFLVAPLRGFVGQAQIASVQSSTSIDDEAGGNVAETADRRVETTDQLNSEIEVEQAALDRRRDILDEQLSRGEITQEERDERVRRSELESVSYIENITSLGQSSVADVYINDEGAISLSNNENNQQVSRATLLSYIYQNTRIDSFLVEQNLEIRGDPYYLGPTRDLRATLRTDQRIEDQPRDNVRVRTDYDYYLFEMQSPRLPSEETGMLDLAGRSYFMTGVYMIKEVTNRFSGGIYTCEVKGIRQTTIDLSQIEVAAQEIGSGDTESIEPGIS